MNMNLGIANSISKRLMMEETKGNTKKDDIFSIKPSHH